MAEKSTFIKLNRKILKWRWYQDANTFRVFVHLLLTANITDHDFKTIKIKRGQLVTSRKSLSDQLGISQQSVRTAINHLISTNEITSSTTSKYTIITINNYNDYQKVTKLLTNNQPATNQQLTNNQPQYKNVKNEKNEKNGKKREGTLSPHGRFENVLLTENEINELKEKYPDECSEKIERLSRYLETTGKRYNNHFATLVQWLSEDVKQNMPKRTASYDIDELEQINTLDEY